MIGEGKHSIKLTISGFLFCFESVLSVKSWSLCCFILTWRNYVVHKGEYAPSLTLIV